jgi:hypothetical protein
MQKIVVDTAHKLLKFLNRFCMRFAWFPSSLSRDINPVDIEDSVAELEKVRDDLSELLSHMAQENQDLRDQLLQLKAAASKDVPITLKTNDTEVGGGNQSDQLQSLQNEIDLYKQENKLILDNMFLTQEELERQLIEKEQLQADCQLLIDRLLRFGQHYPRSFDFSSIEVRSFDGVSRTPYFVCLVRNCHLAGVSFAQIEFKVVLSAGLVGVEVLSAILESQKNIKTVGLIFPGSTASATVPKSSLAQLETSEQWLAHKAAMMAVTFIFDNSWRHISVPDEFDGNFWLGFLPKLIKEFDARSPVFRFDAVQLRQESINPDYEHLWLDILGVTFGDLTMTKLEVRLGAANVKSAEFSRFPKIEFPLIDGAIKPFDSWYAESFDDYGAKYELRFDLDKKRFDVNVWSKLSLADRNLVYALLVGLPKILAIIGKKNKNLHRPIKTWFDFSVETKKVLYDYLRVATKS